MSKAQMGLKSGADRCLSQFALTRIPELVREALAVELKGFGVSAEGPVVLVSSSGADVQFRLPGGRVRVSVEPQAAVLFLNRLLERPARLDSGQELTPGLAGAWAACLLELGRRIAQAEPPQLSLEATPWDAAYEYRFWFRTEGQSFAGNLYVVPAAEAPRSLQGDIGVSYPLVMAQLSVTRAELAELGLGDVWLPQSWTVDAALSGAAIAVAADAELGFELKLEPERISFLGMKEVPVEILQKDEVMSEDSQKGAVLEAPVLVRVEVGGVAMSAREWMALSPGDVLSTAKRLGSAVTLRTAGQEFAKGELVDVEGEIGVRITKMIGSSE